MSELRLAGNAIPYTAVQLPVGSTSGPIVTNALGHFQVVYANYGGGVPLVSNSTEAATPSLPSSFSGQANLNLLEEQQESEVQAPGLSITGKELPVAGMAGVPVITAEIQSVPATLGNWTYPPVRDHVTHTPNYGTPDGYAFTKIVLGDRSPESAWNILTQVHQEFAKGGTDINYDYLKNSNSYATTVLNVIGVDISDYVAAATPKVVTELPGQGVDVLEIKGDAIDLTLKGTGENDIMRTGLGNDNLSGLAGDDKLSGGGGNDKLDGGDNNDTLEGGPGDDTLEGGPGDDTYWGGASRDVYGPIMGHDTIMDFVVGEDTTALADGTYITFAEGAPLNEMEIRQGSDGSLVGTVTYVDGMSEPGTGAETGSAGKPSPVSPSDAKLSFEDLPPPPPALPEQAPPEPVSPSSPLEPPPQSVPPPPPDFEPIDPAAAKPFDDMVIA